MITHTQKGFTLYELLITTLIVGLVLAFGVPNFTAFTQNSRMTTSVNDLLGSFQVARSEAARTKSIVSLCASANATSPDANCGGTFEDGWIVFQDPNGDVERQAGEALVRAHPPISDLITINTAGQGDYFSYGPTALGRGQVGGTAAAHDHGRVLRRARQYADDGRQLDGSRAARTADRSCHGRTHRG